MMLYLLSQGLSFVKRKRRNKHDYCRGSGNCLDGNGLVSSCYESSRKNGEKCSTLASTCHLVHNPYRLVSIPSTLCSRCISMKEYDVETFHSLCHKGFSLYACIP